MDESHAERCSSIAWRRVGVYFAKNLVAADFTHVLALASSALPSLVARIIAAAVSVATNCRRLDDTGLLLSARGGKEQQQNAPLHSYLA